MNYTIVEAATGKVTCTITCPEELISRQFDAQTHFATEGNYSDNEFYHDTEFKPFPLKPNTYCIFNYTTKQWDDPRTAATEWVAVRARRDFLLSDTDWVVTKAVESGNPVPADWKTYRQALRDVTRQADPFVLVWPTSP